MYKSLDAHVYPLLKNLNSVPVGYISITKNRNLRKNYPIADHGDIDAIGENLFGLRARNRAL